MRKLKKKYKYWNAKTPNEIDESIEIALSNNINYRDEMILGVPGSHLDENEFRPDANLLANSTYLQVMINNPNHIGVHTLGKFEPYFKGTHEIEKLVIDTISEDILDGKAEEIDGYISSGGTEGNIQALWIYRNYFSAAQKGKEVLPNYHHIAIVCSDDTHYSIDKAANLLHLKLYKISVDEWTREVDYKDLKRRLKELKKSGVKSVIYVVNMMTTMFGSYDDVDMIVQYLKGSGLDYRIHVDGAYGGFLYPFSIKRPRMNFANKEITSFSLDGHKMLQTPYGTGIFMIRKGYFENSKTDTASYVVGKDYTLIGSRSGANAISVYKVLYHYGPYDWQERMEKLVDRAQWFHKELKKLKIKSIFIKGCNIIAIHKSGIHKSVAAKYGLVADHSDQPTWYKVVVMNHVKKAKLIKLLHDL